LDDVFALDQIMRQLPAAGRCGQKRRGQNRSLASYAAEVSTKAEIKETIDAGATVLIFRDVDENEIKDRIDWRASFRLR